MSSIEPVEKASQDDRYSHQPITPGQFNTCLGHIIWVKKHIKAASGKKFTDKDLFIELHRRCLLIGSAMINRGVSNFKTLSAYQMMAAIFAVNTAIKQSHSERKPPSEQAFLIKNELQLLLVTHRRRQVRVKKAGNGLSKFVEVKYKIWCTHIPISKAMDWGLKTDQELSSKKQKRRDKSPSRHTFKTKRSYNTST